MTNFCCSTAAIAGYEGVDLERGRWEGHVDIRSGILFNLFVFFFVLLFVLYNRGTKKGVNINNIYIIFDIYTENRKL